MSQFCSACGRGALTVNLRSKSMCAVKTRQKVNLQSRRLDGKRVLLCTRCLRTQTKSPGTITVTARTVRLPKRRTKQTAR
ncbi:MAG TPA: hypothetical protein VJB99_03050 [Patescibacteria group bacterium]|nr:hypothetical protein [Patescibacteria group bacterium]